MSKRYRTAFKNTLKMLLACKKPNQPFKNQTYYSNYYNTLNNKATVHSRKLQSDMIWFFLLEKNERNLSGITIEPVRVYKRAKELINLEKRSQMNKRVELKYFSHLKLLKIRVDHSIKWSWSSYFLFIVLYLIEAAVFFFKFIFVI